MVRFHGRGVAGTVTANLRFLFDLCKGFVINDKMQMIFYSYWMFCILKGARRDDVPLVVLLPKRW